ncbi:MAG: RDD family protein [Saprospiraceae bacterium]|nr:RDD family protein [Saprospiraceae bacterium]
MPEISITTTQNVNINFKVANIGVRFLAYFIDLLIKIGYYIMVDWLILSNIGLDDIDLDDWSRNSVQLIFFSPIMFYSLLQESFLEGQTIGKKIMSVKVVKIDGYQASFIDYLIRWVCRLIDVSGTLCVGGSITMMVSKIHQRIGDIAAGTTVITLKNDIHISHTILENIKADYEPKYPQVIRFTDNDMRIIKDTFLIAQENNDQVTMKKLVDKISQVGGITPDGRDSAFIFRVIKDYNYYTGEG